MEEKKLEEVVITKEKVIFVEGMDEVNFFYALLKKMEMGDNYQVIDYKGKSRMSDFISMMSKTDHFNENAISVAVIRDADDNYDFVAKQIKDALKRIFNVINLEHGIMKSEKDINIGFYIMPGVKKNGELEDLVLSSLDGNEIFKEVNNYLDVLKGMTSPVNNGSKFCYPRKESKAKLQIYFSSMKESDTRMGLSAQRNYVDFTHESFKEIIDFIRSM